MIASLHVAFSLPPSFVLEPYNSTWSVTQLSTFFPDSSAGPLDSMFQQYSRPGYDYIGGDPEIDSHIEGYGLVVKDVFQLPENVSLADAGLDVGLALLYSGNRWIGSYFLRTTDLQIMSNAVSNYHGELLGGRLHPLSLLCV